MTQQAPENGVNFVLSWSAIEWFLGMLWVGFTGAVAWVWRLGMRVQRLEDKVAFLEHEIQEKLEEIPDKDFIREQFDRLKD